MPAATRAAQLLRDLQQRGDTGSYGLGSRLARRVRQAQGLAPGQRCTRQTLPVVVESPYQPLTPRRATWLVRRREETRGEAEVHQRAQLPAQHAEGAEAIGLDQEFAQLRANSSQCSLDGSLAEACRPPGRWKPFNAWPRGALKAMRPSRQA